MAANDNPLFIQEMERMLENQSLLDSMMKTSEYGNQPKGGEGHSIPYKTYLTEIQ